MFSIVSVRSVCPFCSGLAGPGYLLMKRGVMPHLACGLGAGRVCSCCTNKATMFAGFLVLPFKLILRADLRHRGFASRCFQDCHVLHCLLASEVRYDCHCVCPLCPAGPGCCFDPSGSSSVAKRCCQRDNVPSHRHVHRRRVANGKAVGVRQLRRHPIDALMGDVTSLEGLGWRVPFGSSPTTREWPAALCYGCFCIRAGVRLKDRLSGFHGVPRRAYPIPIILESLLSASARAHLPVLDFHLRRQRRTHSQRRYLCSRLAQHLIPRFSV